jgi:hypothetical protein
VLANVPSTATVTGEPVSVTAVISVDPWYRLAVIAREPGVKPEPEMVTPVAMLPATICEAPNVIA